MGVYMKKLSSNLANIVTENIKVNAKIVDVSFKEYAKVSFGTSFQATMYISMHKANLKNPEIKQIGSSYAIYVDKK